MNPNILIFLFLIGTQFALCQDMAMPKLDDVDVDAGRAHVVWSGDVNQGPKESGKISPLRVNRFGLKQSYISIEKELGAPFAKEHLIDIDRNRKPDPGNAQWLVLYRHSISENVYYQMLFSGVNGAPDRLMAIDVLVARGGQLLAVGRLSIAAGHEQDQKPISK